ncbi:cysteine desulfurase [Lebetimonas natsushimae]|uniref:cysteine desulfurase n=1 Tax=Lebetimonas natsushimae TaxID=1936991 RepID=A0A292YGG1_9BACT|nr:aminotransferase class V-fold PLP-dependent enzyme [Lebetimonas natsushimae]GAX88093.1 cysteine desulfurase [Lebetimonas natsushimae]
MIVYLDNNSTTPMDERVKEVYCETTKIFGNVNVIYELGIEARKAMNAAYDIIYPGIGASDEDDIIITSSTTEGNNTVIKTFIDAFLKGSPKKHIITTIAEHSSVKATCAYAKTLGMEVTYLYTDENGRIRLDELENAIREDMALISVLFASNESGAIQPIKEIGEIARKYNIPFHCDGAQAIGKARVNVRELGVDYFTFSAHKFHGPKGIGGLYVREGAPYVNLIHGGNQMGGKRGGSVYLNGMVAMAEALKLANEYLDEMQNRVAKLRDKLEEAILKIPDTKTYVDKKYRLPNSVIASFRGIEGEAMLWDLNVNKIYAATGSSCSSERLEGSEVLEALGEDPEIAHTGIIFSLSRFTTEEEIDYVIEKLPKIVKRLRSISMTYARVKPSE